MPRLETTESFNHKMITAKSRLQKPTGQTDSRIQSLTVRIEPMAAALSELKTPGDAFNVSGLREKR